MTKEYWPLTGNEEKDAEDHWNELRAEVAFRRVRYPRSDVLHPEHSKWLSGKLPNYGEAEKAQEVPQKPPKRSRDVALTPQSQSARSRDKSLPRRRSKPAGTP